MSDNSGLDLCSIGAREAAGADREIDASNLPRAIEPRAASRLNVAGERGQDQTRSNLSLAEPAVHLEFPSAGSARAVGRNYRSETIYCPAHEPRPAIHAARARL